MSVPDAAQPREAREEGDRQATVHEPIVHDHIRDPERSHSGADADRDRRRSSVQIASKHDEHRRDRRVRGGESVVDLEAAAPVRMMRAMDAPECMVPDVPVKQASPRLHRGSDRKGDSEPQEHERGRRHEVAP